ncbi:MAG TPA: hypothetical protein VK508_06715 [Cyclobacteriaceae bacterium]|nr:hypothetical protein [Cyclobacteriaceae bacterium]
MKKSLVFVILVLCISLQLSAQKSNQKNDSRIPLIAAGWDSKNGELKFADHNGVPSMEITSGGGMAIAKNLVFSSGTIEYDVEFIEGFTGCYFRRESDDESEFFYLRDRPGNAVILDAVQYTPIIKKVNFWDMLPWYQTAAKFDKGQWTHIKLVISGSQMLAYVNDMSRPTLQIPRLEGNTKQGGISFSGHCFISNVVVKANDAGGLSPAEGFDPTYHDNRYIRNWQVSQPVPLPGGQELTNENLPDISTAWENITAERRGLINLTRLYGNSESRRVVWLRTRVITKKEQKLKLDFGFSDEVWVFVNDRMAFVDKNLYAQGMRKKPDGRISTDNSSFEISLKEGENDLMIGLANDFFGWGIIARIDNLDGITLDTNYKQETINKDLEPYFGKYASKQVPLKIKISQKDNKLSL